MTTTTTTTTSSSIFRNDGYESCIKTSFLLELTIGVEILEYTHNVVFNHILANLKESSCKSIQAICFVTIHTFDYGDRALNESS